MDQELTTYLDRKFAERDEATRRIVEETTQRIVDEATRGVATQKQLEDLREHVDGQNRSLGGEIQSLRETVDHQIRHTHVLIEDLRGDLEQVAEGVVDMNAKFDRMREENEQARREDRAFYTSLFRDTKGRVDDHEVRITRLESARA